MLSEIQELCSLIAPKMFGKPYSQLDFMKSFKHAADSEIYKCAVEASKIRLEALKLMEKETGRAYTDAKWPELLQFCERVLEEKGYMRLPGEDE